jgi:4-amino-4-deoxy-L-arabinose transferase-like glycosyltransferase
MTKMLQGWMVVPALGAAYLLAGPPRLGVRIRQLAVAGAAMVGVSAAWPLAVSAWPGSAPYIGGSTDGSVWDLILGYNGFGRLTGGEGSGGGASFGGVAGVWRLLNEQVGGQVAWLLPLAVAGLAAGLWTRAPRTDLRRAVWVLFGIWALVHVAIFSSQKGTFHPYYVSALAPALAALAGAGLVTLADGARRSWAGLLALDLAVAGTAALAIALLGRTPDFAPWLRPAIAIAAAIAVLGSVALRRPGRLGHPVLAIAAVAAAIAVAAGPASYSVASAGRSLNGNNVIAGPASAAAGGMGAMGGGSRPAGGPPSGGAAPSGTMGGGGLTDEAIAYLQAHQGSAKYLLAANGSQTTASVIIATGEPVVTIGGFSGSDPAPTLAQFKAMVASGELKYVLVSGGGGGPGGGSSEITNWVEANGTAVDAVTLSSGTLYAVGS